MAQITPVVHDAFWACHLKEKKCNIGTPFQAKY